MPYVCNNTATITVTATLATCEVIPYGDKVGGRFHVSTTAATTLTWYDALTETGTFLASLDQYSAAITQTIADGGSYEIPTALAGARYLKAVGDDTATLTMVLKG
jgi:hypothetical protein